MPCFITGSEAGDARLEVDDLQKSLTKVVRMLCDVMMELDNAGLTETIASDKAMRWWKNHKKIDAERIKEEKKKKKKSKLRKVAMKKLSKKERKALGLDMEEE